MLTRIRNQSIMILLGLLYRSLSSASIVVLACSLSIPRMYSSYSGATSELSCCVVSDHYILASIYFYYAAAAGGGGTLVCSIHNISSTTYGVRNSFLTLLWCFSG